MIPKWVGQYVGLPYKPGGRDESGIDCYGLLRLVLEREANIRLPFHDDVMGADAALAIGHAADSPEWMPVDRSQTKAFDAVLMWGFHESNGKAVKLPCHVALMVDHDWALDIERGTSRCIRISNPMIAGRVIAFYRHELL